MADKPKRPPRFDLKSGTGKSGRLFQIGGTAFIVILLVAIVSWAGLRGAAELYWRRCHPR